LALRAKLNLDGDIFFLILLRKTRKKMSPSKEYFAAAGAENLFTQPHIILRDTSFLKFRFAKFQKRCVSQKILRGEAADTPVR
jgi:hypothetical protein